MIQLSLANEQVMPLEPPSPYRPRIMTRHDRSVLPNFFSKKLERLSVLMEKRNAARLPFLEANKQSHMCPTALLRRGGRVLARRVTGAPTRNFSSKPTSMSSAELSYRQAAELTAWLVNKEDEARGILIAEEEHLYTKQWVLYLQTLSELSEPTTMRDDVCASKEERRTEREAMLNTVTTVAKTRRAQERAAAELKEQFRFLLLAYEEGHAAIEEQEQQSLRRVFSWEKKHRPLGACCFLPKLDATSQRMGPPRKVRRSRRVARKSVAQQQIALLRGSRQQGTQSVQSAGGMGVALPPLGEEESHFAEEGLKQYRSQKMSFYASIKRSNALIDLVEEERLGRQKLQEKESTAWMPLLCLGVEGVYEARGRAAVRMAQEKVEADKAEENAHKRQLIKDQLLAVEANGADELTDTAECCCKKLEGKLPDEELGLFSEATTPETVVAMPSLKGIMATLTSTSQTYGDLACEGNSNTALKKKLLSSPHMMEYTSEDNAKTNTAHFSSLVDVLQMEMDIARRYYRGCGNVAQNFACAKEGPFSTAYLMTVLWKTELSLQALSQEFCDFCPKDAHESTADMRSFIYDMLQTRIDLLEEQIELSWLLYCKEQLHREQII